MSQSKLELADSSLHSVTSPVARCYLGKLYFLGFRRGNRYGPTALYHEGKIEALYLTLSDVERFVEPRRKKGTYWEALDVPTVVIESEDSQRLLLVGDGWGGDTLANFQPQLPPQRQFGHLAKALMSQLPKEGWALRSGRQVPVASFPFVRNRSVSGPTLSWRREWWITDPKSAIRLVGAICLWLAEKPTHASNRNS
jgi:hypothetical protein